jgi:hypothetical protein
VGAGLRRALEDGTVARDDVYLQTKFTSVDGQDRAQALPYDLRAPVREQVRQSVARSLANLGVERLDAVVLHSPLRTREATLEAYRALEGCVGENKIGRLGVSNIYDPAELSWLIEAAAVPVSVVQNRWYEGNGWDWPSELPFCCADQSTTCASGTGSRTSPSGRSRAARACSRATRCATSRPGTGARPSRPCTASASCAPRACSPDARWNITPLCGSTNPQHMAEALAVEGLFGRDEPEVASLWKAMRGET